MPRQLYTRPCTTCGTPFVLNTVQLARVRADPAANAFCSPRCAGSGKLFTRCAYCNNLFHPRQVQRQRIRHGGVAYCSRQCFQSAMARMSTYRCAECGGVYYATPEHKMYLAKGLPSICKSCRLNLNARAGVPA